MVRQFIAGCFLALFAFSAIAQQMTEYSWKHPSNLEIVGPWSDSVAGACSGWYGKYVEVSARDYPPQACVKGSQFGYEYRPTLVTNDGTVCAAKLEYWKNSATTCGAFSNYGGGTVGALLATRQVPIPPTCSAGKSKVVTWQLGWSTSFTQDPDLPGGAPPAGYCDGTCEHGLSEVQACHIATEPDASGAYPLTCDILYVSTGKTCGAVTPAPDPGPAPDGGGGDPGGGGGDPGDGGGDPSDGGGDPGDGGGEDGGGTGTEPCPDGQVKDASGACVASTPGGGGGGSTQPGEDTGSECGVAGKPSCTVKVDETGTPSFDADGINEVVNYDDPVNDAIEKWEDILKSNDPRSLIDGNSWSWSFQLPTGCTPLTMDGYGIVINPCNWQSTIHDLMSMIWIISTFFGVLIIARETF